MTVTTIVRVPEVGEVGVPAYFLPSGDLAGTESRWYLTKAPISSALPTLATVGADYASAKLTTENGKATFTPDVPGHYEVEHHDVTVVHTYKTWDEQPDTPDTDNDFAGAPVVTLNTAEALSRYKNQADYRVVETISRTIGAAPNVATVKIVLHEAVEPDRNDTYTFVPANTPIGKIAQYDDAVRGVGDLVNDGRINIFGNFSINRFAAMYQEDALALFRTWNSHVGLSQAVHPTWRVHDSADNTNTVSSAQVTTLAEALTRLVAIRDAFSAHRASAVFHGTADPNTILQIGYLPPYDLPTALTFCRVMWQFIVTGSTEPDVMDPFYKQRNSLGFEFQGHFADGNHGTGGTAPCDPTARVSFDFSSTLAGLLIGTNELTRLYNAHRLRVNVTNAHTVADADNLMPDSFTLEDTAPAEFVTIVNKWIDCIERHTADLDADRAPISPPLHQNTRPIRIPVRAGDLASAIQAFELCCAAMERHALDGGSSTNAHPEPTWAGGTEGAGSGFCFSMNLPAMTRLQKHYETATSGALAAIPPGLNEAPTTLRRMGWK